MICSCRDALGAADDELEEELEEAVEEDECVAGVIVEEKDESGWKDEEDSSNVIPSSELAQEVVVETLEDDVDALFFLDESNFWVSNTKGKHQAVDNIDVWPNSWSKLKEAFL